MPLRPARVGRVGVIGAPVARTAARTAVVAKAVTPGPAPVAKTAVVGRGRHARTPWSAPPDLAPDEVAEARHPTPPAGRFARCTRPGRWRWSGSPSPAVS
jgi:hypothetical protein